MKPIYKYHGLREKPHAEEFTKYLQYGQQVIRYPDRWAKRIRKHPYLTQLDGVGLMEMEQQQEKAAKQQAIEQEIRDIAKDTKATAQMLRTKNKWAQVETWKSEDFDKEYNENIHNLIDAQSKTMRSRIKGKKESMAQTVRWALGTMSEDPTADRNTGSSQV